MSCEKYRELISLYIDKLLNKEEVEELEKHFSHCPECKKEYEELKSIRKLLSETEDVSLPSGFKKELHDKLLRVSQEDNDENMKEMSFKDNIKKVRNKRFNWKILSAIAAILLLIIIPLSNLDNLMMEYQTKDSVREEAARSVETNDIDSGGQMYGVAESKMAAPEIVRQEDFDGEIENMSESALIANEVPDSRNLNSSRKIILNGYLQIDTEDYDKTQNMVIDITKASGGFVQNSYTRYKAYDREDPSKSLKTGNLTIRIPGKDFYNIYNQIKSLGIVVDERINSDDITKEYRDTSSEVENLKAQEKRLREILDSAKDVKEILEVERELTRVRGDIDRLTGNLKTWDDLVDLSTIEVHLNEITLRDKEIQSLSEENIWAKSKKGFIKTTNNIINLLENFLISFISNLPIIMALAVVFVIGYLMIKKFILKK